MQSSLVKTIKGNWLILACLSVAAVLMTLVLVEILGSLADSSQARRGLAGAFHQNARDPNDSKSSLDAARKVAGALKKKNLFAKEPPRENPIKQVDGILGSEALIQNRWYKAGEKIGDATILTISATSLVAEWDGKKTTFSPIAAAPSEPPRPSKPPEPNKVKAAEPNKPVKKADANEVKPAPKADDPLAFVKMDLSPKVREKLLEVWSKLTDEQKEQAKKQWEQMSDEQKQESMKQLEQAIDRGDLR